MLCVSSSLWLFSMFMQCDCSDSQQIARERKIRISPQVAWVPLLIIISAYFQILNIVISSPTYMLLLLFILTHCAAVWATREREIILRWTIFDICSWIKWDEKLFIQFPKLNGWLFILSHPFLISPAAAALAVHTQFECLLSKMRRKKKNIIIDGKFVKFRAKRVPSRFNSIELNEIEIVHWKFIQ